MVHSNPTMKTRQSTFALLSRQVIWTWLVSAGTLFPSRVIFSSRLETVEEFCSWVFEEVLPAIRRASKLEVSLRQELVLKDKEHQEELDRAMRALAIATGCKRWRNTKTTGCKRWRKQLAVKRRRNPQTTRDVCLILGFQNIKDALFKKFKKAYKTSLYTVWDLESSLEPGTEDRAVDKWNKWATLHMM